jgi:hypothetical protein
LSQEKPLQSMAQDSVAGVGTASPEDVSNG